MKIKTELYQSDNQGQRNFYTRTQTSSPAGVREGGSSTRPDNRKSGIRRIRYGIAIAAQAVRALLVGTDKNEIR